MRPLTWPGSRRRRMPFAILEIYFTPLQLRFLGPFTRPWTDSSSPRQLFAWSGDSTPISVVTAFLRQWVLVAL
ncbi:unnamed protein product [Calypogeia fissa]